MADLVEIYFNKDCNEQIEKDVKFAWEKGKIYISNIT